MRVRAARERTRTPATMPSRLRAMLERFHDAAVAICAEHDGVVVESRSDAVLAVFGAPVPHEDSAQRALRTAADARRAHAGAGARAARALWRRDRRGRRGRAARHASGHRRAGRLRRTTRPRRGARRDPARRPRPGASCATPRARPRSARRASGSTPSTTDAPAIRRRLDRPLVGREPELRRLRERLRTGRGDGDGAPDGRRRRTGIGKSRLVARARGRRRRPRHGADRRAVRRSAAA